MAQQAVWARHDMVIRLRNLPKRYSCDDLWYKFHDVLLSLGARPDMRILANQCKQAGSEGGLSPSVHLTFDTPEAVQGSRVGLSDFRASPPRSISSPANRDRSMYRIASCCAR